MLQEYLAEFPLQDPNVFVETRYSKSFSACVKLLCFALNAVAVWLLFFSACHPSSTVLVLVVFAASYASANFKLGLRAFYGRGRKNFQ